MIIVSVTIIHIFHPFIDICNVYMITFDVYFINCFYKVFMIRVRGLTSSASARRREGDVFNALPKPC